jgi:hypothetical protein
MKKRFLVITLLVLLLTAVPLSTAFAAPPLDGDQTVETGETVNNDVILLDGDLEIQTDGHVNGDVVLFNGNADIAGVINGDLVLFNGDLTADETAVINGDCVVLNGEINDHTAGGLDCTNVSGLPMLPFAGLGNSMGWQPGASGEREHQQPEGMGLVGGFFGALGRGVLFALLALAVTAMAPTHMAQVQDTIRQKPLASGTVGFLTAVAVPTLSVFLILISAVLLLVCIGIVGFAAVFALLAALGVAALFGWIAVGDLFGQWLVRRLNRPKMSPGAVAALGVFVLTFGLGLFGLIPFVFGEGLVSMIITFIGLGAVALTKFGTQPYPLVRLVDVKEKPDKVTAVLNTLPDEE